MYPNDSYRPNVNPYVNHPYQAIPYFQYPYYNYNRSYMPYYVERQQTVRGQATWTNGGRVTQCGIPWSNQEYMTVAVGRNTPYQCGQSIKVRNLATQREVIVTVVDQVPEYPANKVSLHRKAFEALGANVDAGVIQVEITPSPELEQEKWGKYLLEVTQTAYPNYNVTDYASTGKTQVSPTQIKETYEFTLKSPRENIKVQGDVIYNSNTDRIVSFNIEEM